MESWPNYWLIKSKGIITMANHLNNQVRLKLYPVRPATAREKRRYPGLMFLDILRWKLIRESKRLAKELRIVR